ncbi:unnamed protein product [Spodoptera exigua]|nr:unnamed protein product [Spodoptera exigua]
MLVVLVILFIGIYADSDEDKYVDLLPEEEKLQFIEQVARRILKDVESQENKTNYGSTEINDEQLKRHNEYVKAVLKEESENIRRQSKLAKNTSNKPDSKDDSEIHVEPSDLTIRNDRRGNANLVAPTDYIKVEIITDELPIIKRSIQNVDPTRHDKSDEITAENLTRVNSSNKTENDENSTVKPPTSSTDRENIITSTASIPETVTETNDHENSTDVNESEDEVTDEEKPTTVETIVDKKDDIKLAQDKNSGSKETDSEGAAISDIDEPLSKKSTDEYNVTEISNITATTSAIELFGLKSDEKILDESNHISSEEITTVKVRKTKATTDKNNIEDEKDDTTTDNDTDEPKIRADADSENEGTGTESTTTITTNVEKTTQPVPLTTETEIEEVETSDPLTTEYPETTTEFNIIVEEFTSPPVNKTKQVKKKKTKRRAKEKKIKQRALDHTREIAPEILVGSDKYVETETSESGKTKVHKLGKVFLGPKGKKDEEVKAEKPNPDKNFIELEKVYYDNNYKVKQGNGYQVYEISADKTPFIKDEVSMVEQPFYVPIYNYAPQNAYFNPENRLGPNPGDPSVEKLDISADDEVIENLSDLKPNENYNEEIEIEEYNSKSDLDIRRKKFGNEPRYIYQQQFDSQNDQDYADVDYYFGRQSKRRNNKGELNTFPNSDENDHPTHSIQEGNLKDHVRAVRNILFHQKSFGLLDKDKYGHDGNEQFTKKIIRKRILRQRHVGTDKIRHHALRNSVPEEREPNNHDKVRKHQKEQTVKVPKQYNVDRVKLDETVSIVENKGNDIILNDEHIKKVGYLKNNNSTKELYVIDDYFKQNILKFMEHQRQNERDQLNPATPLPPTPHGKYLNINDPFIKTESFSEINSFVDEHDLPETHENDLKNHKHFKIKNNSDEKKTVKKHPLHEIQISEHNNTTDDKMQDYQDLLDKHEKLKAALLKEVPEIDNLKKGYDEMNLNLKNRRKDEVKLGVYLKVLKDMINTDNNALRQYDWLGSTVDIQSALQKIYELTGLAAARRKLHPSDMEILKYVLFLQELGTEIIEANDFGDQLRKNIALDQNIKQKALQLLEGKGLKNKVWLYLRKEVPDVYEIGAMRKLNRFLMSIEDNLFELHDAVKNIAKITKYKNQHWYDNLRNLYINTEDKTLLELLLHVTVLRLFTLIEDGTKNGLEDNYILYMKKNKKEAKRTLDEMIFVMQILDEYNKLVR